MKKILFLMAILPMILFSACSDSNDFSFDDIDDNSKQNKVYYDGTFYVPYVTNDYAYKFSEDGTMIWKNKIQYPANIISESYGEKTELEYKRKPTIALFRKNYALHFISSTITTSYVTKYTYTCIYTPDGKLVKQITHNGNVNIYSWTNDVVLVSEDSRKTYWLSSTGDESEFEHKDDLIFYNTYIPISDIGYVTFHSTDFIICNFQKGNNTNVLHEFIRQKYENNFQIEITSAKVQETDVIVNVNVIMKSNEKYNLTLKISSTTFACEEIS
ncbi:hypothetical protein [Bacteroides oleiciplenus]|uniref:DUF4595 domain-containing protein n=1 Tax=Bacteroides oleiciplenus YIT 12058 TaxID=742727 RepID=K9E257_9BACE|nr:hypothetical protein [Bacteroides oleiciplenus]EKU89771.1 hypothetical protein HMPREF9447_03209 [Bacteroides oleiciplenus YIT 12058]